jgi:hypothetical protein
LNTYGVLSARAERALAGAASATEAKDKMRKLALVFIAGNSVKKALFCVDEPHLVNAL